MAGNYLPLFITCVSLFFISCHGYTMLQAAELVSRNISDYSQHMEKVRDHLERLLEVCACVT